MCLIKNGRKLGCRRFERVAQNLLHLEENILSVYEWEGEIGIAKVLGLLRGGKPIVRMIVEFITQGSLREYEEGRRMYGEAVEFPRVRGIGPKTASLLVAKGIRTFEELLKFLEREEARSIFKRPEEVLKNVKFYLSQRKLILAPELRALSEAFCKLYPSAVPVGPYRRGEPFALALEFALSEEDAFSLIVSGRYEEDAWLWGGFRIPLKIHPFLPKNRGRVILEATGPQQHLQALRSIGSIGDAHDEEEIYRSLDLPYIHPFQRYDGEEVKLALKGKLPKPILPENLLGDLHVHTTYSDGSMTPEEVIQRSIRLGYSVVALTDHSPSTGSGLNEIRLREKYFHVLRLREKYPYIEILFGAEVDILPDGSLDYPDEVLEKLDFVIATIHNWKDGEDQTDRLLKALENPYVYALGHPTGRVLKKRPPYEVDMDRILKRAEELGKLIEINANPKRVDPEAPYLFGYKGMVSIGTDAHKPWDMLYAWLGCAQASRSRIPSKRIFNGGIE